MAAEDQVVVYKSRRLCAAPALGMIIASCFAVLALAVPAPTTVPEPAIIVLRVVLLILTGAMFALSAVMGFFFGITEMRISASGLEIRYWRFRRVRFDWADLVEFFPERGLLKDYVAFTLSPGYKEKARRQRFSGIHKGCLPDTYGFTAEALARLLNEQRRSVRRSDR